MKHLTMKKRRQQGRTKRSEEELQHENLGIVDSNISVAVVELYSTNRDLLNNNL